MIEIISADFAAGEVKTFLIQGEYLEVIDAIYPIDVAMMDRSGAQLSTMRNAEASFFSRPGLYEVLQVTSDKAQKVRLFVGSGDAGTRRTSGVVQVVDGGKFRTLANVAFSGYASIIATAAIFSHVQLWNSSTDKNIVIERVSFGSAVAGLFYFRGASVACTTLIGNAPSKMVDGAVSNAELRTQANAAFLGNAIPIYPWIIAAASVNNSQIYMPNEPIILPPGKGLILQAGLVNQDVYASFEFYEDKI